MPLNRKHHTLVTLHRVTLVIAHLGWFGCSVILPSCPATQNLVGGGLTKDKVIPNQVRDHQSHPVEYLDRVSCKASFALPPALCAIFQE